MHQYSLDGNSWKAAWRITTLEDPFGGMRWGGTAQELSTISGLLKAEADLDARLRERNPKGKGKGREEDLEGNGEGEDDQDGEWEWKPKAPKPKKAPKNL